MMERHTRQGVVWHSLPALADSRRLLTAISTRHGGVSAGHLASLNLGDAVGDDPSHVQENRARLSRALGIDPDSLVTVRQVHGRRVVYRDDTPSRIPVGDPSEAADGLITDRPGVALWLRFADCVPILAYDQSRHVVGLAHAGWRGTLAGISGGLVREMGERFGTQPEHLRAVVGPSIGPCCYEVGPEILDLFRQTWSERDGLVPSGTADWRLDLWQANQTQLVASGIPADQVVVAGICTACHCDEYFSHRAQRGTAGRFAAVVALM